MEILGALQLSLPERTLTRQWYLAVQFHIFQVLTTLAFIDGTETR
jgi:hypothetical protein